MSLMYYGSKISDNIIEMPEGYLITKSVPIGRTGSMEYHRSELQGLDVGNTEVVTVTRSTDELFSKATIASFEGKPTTNNHPPYNLDIDTIKNYQCGHAQNVRQEGLYLVADLLWTDKQSIEAIKKGKREISCGYEAVWVQKDDGWEQTNIIGNHIALVDEGRAGHTVAIKDQKKEEPKMGLKEFFDKHLNKTKKAEEFKKIVADSSATEIAAMLDEESPAEEKQETTMLETIASKIDELIKRVEMLEKSDKEVHKEVEDTESILKNLDEGDTNIMDQESEIIEPEKEEKEEKTENKDKAMSDLIEFGKKMVLAIENKDERYKAAKLLQEQVKQMRGKNPENAYAKVQKATEENRQKAMDKSNKDNQDMRTKTEIEYAKVIEEARKALLKGG